jgi:hypothetical protein
LSVAVAALNIPRADASTATVAITGGGLTLANPSVRVIGENPTRLEVNTSVTDARGTGAGWFLSLAAATPYDSRAQSLIVTGARMACEPGSACTLPDSDIPYPLPVSVNGTRSWVFEANPSSGLGTQTVDMFITVPPGVGDPLNLGFSISTQPPGGAVTPTLPPSAAAASRAPECSVDEMLTMGSCRTTP